MNNVWLQDDFFSSFSTLHTSWFKTVASSLLYVIYLLTFHSLLFFLFLLWWSITKNKSLKKIFFFSITKKFDIFLCKYGRRYTFGFLFPFIFLICFALSCMVKTKGGNLVLCSIGRFYLSIGRPEAKINFKTSLYIIRRIERSIVFTSYCYFMGLHKNWKWRKEWTLRCSLRCFIKRYCFGYQCFSELVDKLGRTCLPTASFTCILDLQFDQNTVYGRSIQITL